MRCKVSQSAAVKQKGKPLWQQPNIWSNLNQYGKMQHKILKNTHCHHNNYYLPSIIAIMWAQVQREVKVLHVYAIGNIHIFTKMAY